MNEPKYVKIIDLDTMKVTEIPRAELSDQMVPAQIQGKPGEFWVDVQQAMGRSKAMLHPPFSGNRKESVEAIASMFAEIFPQSYEEWELGFRRDANPDQEIAIWLRSGKIFTEFSRQRGLDSHQREELAKLLFQCQVVPLDQLEAVRINLDLPKEICDDFINAYYGSSARTAFTVAEVLKDPEPLRQADVILAVDLRSGEWTVLQGLELLDIIVKQNRPGVDLVTVSCRNRAELRAIRKLVRKFQKGN